MKRDGVAARIACALAAALVFVAGWPFFSRWWVSILESVGGMFGTNTAVPGSASVTLPVVVIAMLVLERVACRGIRRAAPVIVSTLLAELLLVLIASSVRFPAGLLSFSGAMVQDVIPLGWLVHATLAARNRGAHESTGPS